MAANSVVEFLRHLRHIERVREADNETDRQLLERFLRNKDTVALETLVRRYAPMVWGVCRRTVFNHHDAEDAFQATFFVLVRKAAMLRRRKSVAGWLHVAAHKTAQRARQMTRRRFEHERQVTVMPEPKARTTEQTNGPELQDLLDDALSQLPERYRSVVVLCDLQEKTRPQAARQLGVPEGTVGSRLARGRALLAKRLARRGLAVSGATVAALLSKQTVSAAVPGSLLSSTIRVAGLLAAGQGAGALSAQVSALTKGVLKAMALAKYKTVMLVLLVVGLVPSGGLLAHHLIAFDSAPSGGALSSPSLVENAANVPDVAPPLPLSEPFPIEIGDVRSFKPPRISAGITAVGFTPDQRCVVSCAEDGVVRKHDIATSKELWAFDTGARPAAASTRDLAVSPDGNLALVAVQDHTVRVLDMATGEELRRFTGHKARVLGVSFSSNGRLALSGSGAWDAREPQDNTVRMWDVATATEIRCFTGHKGWVSTPVFSPDDRFVLSPSSDCTIRLWDAQTGDLVREFTGHTGFIRTAVFSRDGKFVLSSSEDCTVRLWEAETGRQIRCFKGHTFFVEAAILSADARRATSAGKEGAIRVWDVASEKELLSLTGHDRGVNALVLSRNQQYVLSGGVDGTLRLWRLPDPAPAPQATSGSPLAGSAKDER
jgi:RNA polymerase sigma factor (sigma-70 family)